VISPSLPSYPRSGKKLLLVATSRWLAPSGKYNYKILRMRRGKKDSGQGDASPGEQTLFQPN
jgi:hypothetical protein